MNAKLALTNSLPVPRLEKKVRGYPNREGFAIFALVVVDEHSDAVVSLEPILKVSPRKPYRLSCFDL